MVKTNALFSYVCITFTFINLVDAFIQSDLQLRNTISDTLERGKQTGSACNTNFWALFRANSSQTVRGKGKESEVFFF